MPKAKSLSIDFSQEKEAGYQRVYSRSPLLTNLPTLWNGFYFAYDCQPAHETPEVFAPQHGVAIFTQVPKIINYEQSIDGQFYRKQIFPGDIVITPANIATRAQWDTAFSIILLGFEQVVFRRAIYESFDPDQVELAPHFAISDPLVYQIGLALKTMLENDGAGSRLYAETMANALAVHLLQNYSTQKLSWRDYQDGLPRHKLQIVIDYIHAHLNEDIGLAELAALVQMSPRYFLKLFKTSTGFTPHKFVIHTRIARAKELLLLKQTSIAEIALKVGFANQSNLNMHFKRLLGVTPKQFQNK
ncbi:AraC family transcriptional regulator [Chlorogloeopsis sp. ULAP01]|uniref:helix-turn-helix domain-containing protein n=1 Tax=Chlorogloeopsis sp. ULAP01 TaxID=3056483 RepID=UPI0025AAD27E|nr:AraC family transcriptional regulator [Chlorogloeopsis sp. ULAP01]MDM9381304.1 AraC family transcriptional regulator [Chlorogloeopsis sp. ULAP01]